MLLLVKRTPKSVEPGFSKPRSTVIRELALENRDLFLEKWNAYFSAQG